MQCTFSSQKKCLLTADFTTNNYKHTRADFRTSNSDKSKKNIQIIVPLP